ncbi:hypothetical protein D3C80_1823830 [compost metagenome]
MVWEKSRLTSRTAPSRFARTRLAGLVSISARVNASRSASSAATRLRSPTSRFRRRFHISMAPSSSRTAITLGIAQLITAFRSRLPSLKDSSKSRYSMSDTW